jgi:hypothetical protein
MMLIPEDSLKKNARREKPHGNHQAPTTRRRMHVHPVSLVLLVVGVFTVMAFFILHGKQTGAQSSGPPAAQEPVATAEVKAEFHPLKGRWQRPDGGYVIEIKGVDAAGKMAAGYFNPRPINVARAEASMEGTTLKVFIELRDMNYPGATYNLTYEPGGDQLRGVYFQPALQQSFDVFFVRMK